MNFFPAILRGIFFLILADQDVVPNECVPPGWKPGDSVCCDIAPCLRDDALRSKVEVEALKGNIKAARLLAAYGQDNDDIEQERRWLTIAALRDDVPSQLNLGNLLLKHAHSNQEREEAITWLKKAANADDSDAMLALSEAFAELEDKRESFYWVLKSAEQGKFRAMEQVALNYLEGNGTAVDLVCSCIWFTVATHFANNAFYQEKLKSDFSKNCSKLSENEKRKIEKKSEKMIQNINSKNKTGMSK